MRKISVVIAILMLVGCGNRNIKSSDTSGIEVCPPERRPSFDEGELLATIAMIENDIDGFKDKLDERSRHITDSTSLYWNVFAYLCEDGEYQKASDYFLENTGALIIYPPHSHLRSRLIIDIAKPLLLEYQPVDKARKVYMDLLQMEFYGQMLTWDTHGSEYCPASLPDVILEYGVCLAQTGKKEEAIEMKDIMYASAKDIWGDETVAQYLRYQLLIK